MNSINLKVGNILKIEDLRDEFVTKIEGRILEICKSLAGNTTIITLDTGWKIILYE